MIESHLGKSAPLAREPLQTRGSRESSYEELSPPNFVVSSVSTVDPQILQRPQCQSRERGVESQPQLQQISTKLKTASLQCPVGCPLSCF